MKANTNATVVKEYNQTLQLLEKELVHKIALTYFVWGLIAGAVLLSAGLKIAGAW